MQGEERKAKIIFTDAGVDKALTGTIISEDEFFITLDGFNGRRYRLGKKAIISVENLP